MSCKLICTGQAEDAITEYHGDIQSSGSGEVLGRVVARVVDIDTGSFPVFDVLDCMDGDSSSHLALFDKSGGYSAGVLRILGQDYTFSRNMLVIDKLELLPNARGQGLSEVVLDLLIRKLGSSCRIAIVKPFPLQHAGSFSSDTDDWAKQMRYEGFNRNFSIGLAKLKRLYYKANFRPLEQSHYMVRNLSKTFNWAQ
jgi:hypothetical protein